MEYVALIVGLALFVIQILMIVKFFQIAADLRVIKRNLCPSDAAKDESIAIDHDKQPQIDENRKFKIDDHVVKKNSGQQYRIIGFDKETTSFYICSASGGQVQETLHENEIELFADYARKYKK